MKPAVMIVTGLLMNGPSYLQRIKALFGSSLIGYWPLDETSGTTAYDKSGNNYNGTYVGVSLAGAVNPLTHRVCPVWGGANGQYVSLTTPLAGVINSNEGAVGMLCSPDSGITASASERSLFEMDAADGSLVVLGHRSTAYTWCGNRYTGSGYDPFNTYDYFYAAGWHTVLMTWSKINSISKVYIDGNLVASASITNSIATAVQHAIIGATSSSGGSWKGSISNFFGVNRYVTPAEALTHFKISSNFAYNFGILGDSISIDQASYPPLILSTYKNTYGKLANHAVGGNAIVSDLATQVAAAASDNNNIIIIAMGTNDNNAGNMTTLGTAVENAIIALRASNPAATIYYMNVLPRWTDNTGATPVDKSNIRTAITTACANQSITCWDTFTTPWITAAQTSNGLHPTAAGYAAIAAQVLSKLP